jgi:hypothetical protein
MRQASEKDAPLKSISLAYFGGRGIAAVEEFHDMAALEDVGRGLDGTVLA